jgi:two-component system NarL family sensor kinase
MLPVTAATLLGPWRTALASAGAVAAYVAIAVLHPARPDALGFESAQTLFLAWVGLAAVLLSTVLTARARQIQALADSRGRLVAQALDADDRARKRLAEALHDDALQNLLAARQMLGGPLDGDSIALARNGLEDAVGQIRDAIFDLHPHLLEQAGLRAALEAVARRQAGRGGYVPSVRVDPAASGPQDPLLFSIARELITNVTKHAAARRLDVEVAPARDAVELRVRDDGAGMDPAVRRAAVLDGHIGLATARERAEAVGGRFDVRSRAGAGTEVVVRLPAGGDRSAGSAPAATGSARPL